MEWRMAAGCLNRTPPQPLEYYYLFRALGVALAVPGRVPPGGLDGDPEVFGRELPDGDAAGVLHGHDVVAAPSLSVRDRRLTGPRRETFAIWHPSSTRSFAPLSLHSSVPNGIGRVNLEVVVGGGLVRWDGQLTEMDSLTASPKSQSRDEGERKGEGEEAN